MGSSRRAAKRFRKWFARVWQGGELFDRIAECGGLPEDEARRYFVHIVSALHHCHQNHVYHRDLKPENILLDGQVRTPHTTQADNPPQNAKLHLTTPPPQHPEHPPPPPTPTPNQPTT